MPGIADEVVTTWWSISFLIIFLFVNHLFRVFHYQKHLYYERRQTHVRFSTVALFSVLHEAVAALLPPDQVLHVGHVVQTHTPSLLEVAVQVTFTAAAEHSWERMPSHTHTQLLCDFLKFFEFLSRCFEVP